MGANACCGDDRAAGRSPDVVCLDPSAEIQAYVDLHRQVFQSESMTHAWRTHATQMTDYINALDLVIASDQGEIFGFCVAWLRRLASGETVGQAVHY